MTGSTRHTDAAARGEIYDPPDDHITTQLGAWIVEEERGQVARTTLHSAMWGEGSNRTRLSAFVSIADALAGATPEPSRFPTIDLRAHLVGDPPSRGPIEIVGLPLRVGRRFVVVESVMFDEHANVFGRATATMLNNLSHSRSPGAPFEPAVRLRSIDRLLRTRPVDERTIEMDLTPQLVNGGIDTPFGGAQAWFAELAVDAAQILATDRAVIAAIEEDEGEVFRRLFAELPVEATDGVDG